MVFWRECRQKAAATYSKGAGPGEESGSQSSADGLPEPPGEESLRGGFSFRPHERIRRSPEFHHVKKSGRRAKSLHFGLNYIPNDLEHHRLGLVVQKRFWCAVQRNRIKRVIREWFRSGKDQISKPARDIVLIARPGAEKLAPEDISRELLPVLNKQGK